MDIMMPWVIHGFESNFSSEFDNFFSGAYVSRRVSKMWKNNWKDLFVWFWLSLRALSWSILLRSSINSFPVRLLKFLLYISFFLLPLVFCTGNNTNCARWSDIDVIILPKMGPSGLSVEKMLSSRVFDFVLIWVGDVIWVSKDDEYIWSRN